MYTSRHLIFSPENYGFHERDGSKAAVQAIAACPSALSDVELKLAALACCVLERRSMAHLLENRRPSLLAWLSFEARAVSLPSSPSARVPFRALLRNH